MKAAPERWLRIAYHFSELRLITRLIPTPNGQAYNSLIFELSSKCHLRVAETTKIILNCRVPT
ncbi:hypothetical protein SCA6_012177 [Theobroma cacao]